jgi:hypothetical protein
VLGPGLGTGDDPRSAGGAGSGERYRRRRDPPRSDDPHPGLRSTRGFDCDGGHATVGPDREIISDTAVTAGNVPRPRPSPNGSMTSPVPVPTPAGWPRPLSASPTPRRTSPTRAGHGSVRVASRSAPKGVARSGVLSRPTLSVPPPPWRGAGSGRASPGRSGRESPRVDGDAGEFVDHLARAGISNRCTTEPPADTAGRFSPERLCVELGARESPARRGGSPPFRVRHLPTASRLRYRPAGRTITVAATNPHRRRPRRRP